MSCEKRPSDLEDTVQLLQWIIRERNNEVELQMSDHNTFIYESLRCDWRKAKDSLLK